MSVPLSAKILKSYETYTCNGLISSARIFLMLTHFQIFSYLRRGWYKRNLFSFHFYIYTDFKGNDLDASLANYSFRVENVSYWKKFKTNEK